MNKKTRILISCVLVFIALFFGSVEGKRLSKKNQQAEAAGETEYFIDKNNKIKMPAGGNSTEERKTRGTEDNPFFVLEIVPYEGMASFGYQIKGCEPVDVTRVGWEGKNLPDNGALINATQKNLYYWEEELPSGYSTTGTTKEKTTQYGEMTYVVEGGDYKRSDIVYTYVPAAEDYVGTRYKKVTKDGKTSYEEDENGDYRQTDEIKSAKYTKVTDHSGEFNFQPLTVEECLSMTETEKDTYLNASQKVTDKDDKIKMFFSDVNYYLRYSGYVYTHKNIFLKECVGLGYKRDAENNIKIPLEKYDLDTMSEEEKEAYEKVINDFKAVVYTVTPEDLNHNTDLINRADLIVISSFSKDSNYLTLFNNYKKTELFSKDPSISVLYNKEKTSDHYTNFSDNPIDWSVAKEIYERATDLTRRCPILMDTNVYGSTFNDSLVKTNMKRVFGDGKSIEVKDVDGTANNMYKLFLMLTQMRAETFIGLYQDANGLLLDGDNFSTADVNTNKYLKGTTKKLQTGVFKLAGGNDAARKYWNKFTLLPWSILPDSSYNDSKDGYGPFFVNLGIANDSNASSKLNINDGKAQDSVRNCIYVNCGGNALVGDFNNVDSASNVGDDEYGSDPYDFFDSVNGSAKRPKSLSPAQVIFSLLHDTCLPKDPLPDEDYRVLELEPSPIYRNDDYFKAIISTYAKTTGSITVDRMTTSEFIGKKVEVSSDYDLVYIGMNKSSEDKTMEFPSGTTNFVYAHSGPTVEITGKNGMYGLLSKMTTTNSIKNYLSAEQKFIFSGNDLTKAAMKKLEDFRDNGGVLLFSNGFYSGTKKAAVASTIDLNSYIYQLSMDTDNFDEALIDAGNADEVKRLVSLLDPAKRMNVFFEISPVLYNSNYTKDADKYINGGVNQIDNKYLNFKFTVKAPDEKSYYLKIYADTDGDGRYSDDESIDGSLFYANGIGGKKGNPVTTKQVVNGKTYFYERQISGRIGSVDWKLDFIDTSNNMICYSINGVSAIKADTDEVEKIPILQILTTKPSFATWDHAKQNVYLPTANDDLAHNVLKDINGNKISVTNNQLSVTKKFDQFIKQINNGLDISFTRLTQEQLIQKAREKVGKPTATGDELTKALNAYLKEYKMIVLGFADVYEGVTDQSVINAIEKFRYDGKAILYTHDTSSYVGIQGSKPDVWGAKMSQQFRSLFGMDRYSIQSISDTDMVEKKFYDTETYAFSRKDFPLLPTNDSSKIGDMVTAQDKSKSKTFALAQGYANGSLFLQKYEGTYTFDDSNLVTREITLVNKGGITQYPFTLKEKMDIAPTHPQYLQLDLNDEFMNVWYCLSLGNATANGVVKYFKNSPNDVRNNYYIYNVKNVTYSGMGHKGDLTDDEIKLFINTFVAAYRATSTPVGAVVDNIDSVKSGDDYFMCVDVDSSDASTLIGYDITDRYRTQTMSGENYSLVATATSSMSKLVKFYIKETNTTNLTNPKYWLSFKVSDDSGTMVSKPLAVFKASDDTFVNKVTDISAKKESVYYVEVPLAKNQVGTKADGTPIYEILNTNVEIYVNPQYKLPTGDYTDKFDEDELIPTKVTIMPRGLFDLD